MKLQTQTTQYVKLRQLSKSRYNYNGSIFTLNNINYLIYRCQNSFKERSWLGCSQLNDKFQAINYKCLETTSETTEDPRVQVLNNQVYVFYNSGETDDMVGWRSKSFTINCAKYDSNFNLLSNHELLYADSLEVEKNWLPFYDRERKKWYCIYSINPWTILEFDSNWHATKAIEQDYKLPWDYGIIRGGTCPLTALPDLVHRVSGREDISCKYYTFFHSRYDYPVRRLHQPPRYYGGAISFSTDYPYKPSGISRFPVLEPSETSAVQAKVVFPSGALLDDNSQKFIISSGSGDSTMRIDTFDRDDIISHSNRLILP